MKRPTQEQASEWAWTNTPSQGPVAKFTPSPKRLISALPPELPDPAG